ncbi:hypothetical protein JKP88DRAFT_243983 [Tribonema minus]|uniref:Uncharacterized protein n=1 Tax=Tribonema minus TaxID=303371 RepID=A0A835Z6S3_9STRA|nr:hypothetical protein JKP88DRAFT_243983 [Tribonema minus]
MRERLDELTVKVFSLGAELSDVVTTLNDVVDSVNGEQETPADTSVQAELTILHDGLAAFKARYEDAAKQLSDRLASSDVVMSDFTKMIDDALNEAASQSKSITRIVNDLHTLQQQVDPLPLKLDSAVSSADAVALKLHDAIKEHADLVQRVEAHVLQQQAPTAAPDTSAADAFDALVQQVAGIATSHQLLTDDGVAIAGRVDALTADVQHMSPVLVSVQRAVDANAAAAKESVQSIAKIYEALKQFAKVEHTEANKRALSRTQADLNQLSATHKADMVKFAAGKDDFSKRLNVRFEDLGSKIEHVMDALQEQNNAHQEHSAAMGADIAKGLALVESKLHKSVMAESDRHLASVKEAHTSKLTACQEEINCLKEEVATMKAALDVMAAEKAAAEAEKAPKKRVSKKKTDAVIEVLKDD